MYQPLGDAVTLQWPQILDSGGVPTQEIVTSTIHYLGPVEEPKPQPQGFTDWLKKHATAVYVSAGALLLLAVLKGRR